MSIGGSGDSENSHDENTADEALVPTGKIVGWVADIRTIDSENKSIDFDVTVSSNTAEAEATLKINLREEKEKRKEDVP